MGKRTDESGRLETEIQKQNTEKGTTEKRNTIWKII
jgi:hypothetical protein